MDQAAAAQGSLIVSKILFITQPCIGCGETSQVTVEVADFLRWRLGAYAQDVWPQWTAGERELLISGTHDACFDAMFAEPEPLILSTDGEWVEHDLG